MDLTELSERTGLPIRRLRYVVDHKVLPGMRAEYGVSAGAPRVFTDFECFAIAIAGALMEAGMRRESAARLMELLSRAPATRKTAQASNWLLDAFGSNDGTAIEIGDDTYVRFIGAKSDTAWREPVKLQPLKGDPRPLVRVTVDLDQLARRLRS